MLPMPPAWEFVFLVKATDREGWVQNRTWTGTCADARYRLSPYEGTDASIAGVLTVTSAQPYEADAVVDATRAARDLCNVLTVGVGGVMFTPVASREQDGAARAISFYRLYGGYARGCLEGEPTLLSPAHAAQMAAAAMQAAPIGMEGESARLRSAVLDRLSHVHQRPRGVVLSEYFSELLGRPVDPATVRRLDKVRGAVAQATTETDALLDPEATQLLFDVVWTRLKADLAGLTSGPPGRSAWCPEVKLWATGTVGELLRTRHWGSLHRVLSVAQNKENHGGPAQDTAGDLRGRPSLGLPRLPGTVAAR